MKNNQIIITINSLDDIKKLKELGIIHYAYPLKGFCVGIPNTFLLSEIKSDGYLFINRILDNQGIDNLKKILENLPSQIKGIIFDDLGIMELVKNLNIEKILYLSHFNTNYESIKIYLNYVDSVILATDITKDEIEYIIDKIPNKLTVFVLGYVGAMYSRRRLISNYCEYHHLEYKNTLEIDNTNHKFLVYENEYGTYMYHKPLFNGLTLLREKAQYFFINSAFLSIDDITDLLNDNSKLEYDDGFLNTETIYKLNETVTNDEKNSTNK